MFGHRRFFSTGAEISTTWAAGTVTCTVFGVELGVDPKGMDLQLEVDALNGDTFDIETMSPGSTEWRTYQAGATAADIVMIDAMVQGFRVTLVGAAATDPVLIVNHRRRGL
jgi:hypothetical protein